MGTDLLSDIRRDIDARLAQLRPALAEYEQLLEAADALGLKAADGLGLGGDAPAPASATQARAARGATRARTAPVRRSGATAMAPRGVAATPKLRVVGAAAREAILGVLEHGSHTVAELTVVTAMSAASLNGNLRKLAAEGVVAKTRREGKVAWSLVAAD